MTTLVLGIGNILLSDEGFGVHAMRALSARVGVRQGVDFVDGGTLSFTLAAYIAEADSFLVFDAAELGAAPGTLKTFEGEDFDAFLNGTRKRTVHEVGLLDLVSIARLEDRLPARRMLVAAQAAEIGWGEALTPTLQDALPRAVAEGLSALHRWGIAIG